MDLLEEDMAGYISMSLIVYSKLYGELKRVLIQRYNSNYPTLKNILWCYNITKTVKSKG